ncbi:MAG TPA: TIGR03016 family PEP-CTERM system-associated outer membrane protein [Casimicrobiaceae bacterium]|nr:TIGR03016 family PEP-CTERM system-associated outer membrane protein [Casimicrobiaceae bacterium]
MTRRSASRALGCAASAITLAVASAHAAAQTWRLTPSITAQLEATNNVNLGSGDQREGDFLTQIQPALAVSEHGAHTSVTGSIVLPILLYARTGSENNAVRPEVNLTGKAELVQQLFFIDASANVSQDSVSPFGPRPVNAATATVNRATAQSYMVSPYFKGQGANDINYELRDSNTWTVANGIAATGNQAYSNEVTGHLDQTPKPLGFALDYDRLDTNFTDSGTLITEIERARVEWRPEPDWQLAAIGGYEDNRFPLAGYNSAIYGVEVRWKPSDRTNVDAQWQHRFFGSSYQVGIQETTRLTVWSLRAFRDITTYPQQLATLGVGANVNTLLNQLFASRVSDPTQRQTIVDQLISERGIPSLLTSPISLFSNQVTLQDSVEGSVGLLGARNTIFLTAFRTKSAPVKSANPSPIDLLLFAQTNNTQTGTNVVWTHRLTSLYSLATSFAWTRAIANDVTNAHSTQATLQTTLSAPLSRSTSVFAGLRYQRFWSDVNPDFNEAAAFVGMTHVFR